MENTKRRSFLCTGLSAGLASLPLALLGQNPQASSKSAVTRVPGGEDRFGEHHTLGVSLTDFKVATSDAHGGLFVLEHTSQKPGGPPRHIHHDEEEWWYVIAGEYMMEIGGQRIPLKPGDSILGPRGVPHVWAFTGPTPGQTTGKMLIAFAPANKMEAYFRAFKPRAGAYSKWDDPNDMAIARAHGIDLVGPPMTIG